MREAGRLAAALALAVGLSAAVCADETKTWLEGRVVAVVDGDTAVVSVDGASREIRLAGIDAPEYRQPWSRRAKRALTERVAGKPVRIKQIGVDRYGRTVGELYTDDVCVGCELVREGHAWVYRRYSDDAVLTLLEDQARAAGRGLWGLPASERIPPWEWRHARDGSPDRERVDAKSLARCGPKRRCAEMTDCAEARRYLACGLPYLDGDGDGTPCDALCRP